MKPGRCQHVGGLVGEAVGLSLGGSGTAEGKKHFERDADGELSTLVHSKERFMRGVILPALERALVSNQVSACTGCSAVALC